VAFGTLHTLSGHAAFATATARSEGLAFRLGARHLQALFGSASAGRGVAEGLCAELLRARTVNL